MIENKKLAIFGGTFNPPHLGHKKMIEMLLGLEIFENIIVMPSFIPPHKKGNFAPARDRFKMCCMSFGGLKGVTVSDFEISMGGKSYTVLTLEELKKQGIVFPGFVVGADSLVNFHKWYRYEDILKLAHLVVYKRAGVSEAELLSAKANLEALGGKITLLDFYPPDISSTEIRETLKQGGSAEEFLTESVNEYIIDNGLYIGKNFNEPEFFEKCTQYREKYNEYVELLKGRLTSKRFYHSLCVAKEAVRLAEKYQCDTDKAFFAGLMHDVCKDMERKQQLKLAEQFGIIMDSTVKKAPKLWHSVLGAAYLEQVLNVTDRDVINAVKYHTTARAGMSLLEKIIFLADFTSQDRDYDGADEMRIAVDKSMEDAMYEALDFSVKDLEKKGAEIHKDTMDAYLEIKNIKHK